MKQKYYQEQGNNKPKRTLLLLGVIIAVLAITQVFVANQTASSGEKVGNIDLEIEKINDENRNLEVDIAKASSLKNIQEQADKFGFTRARTFVYLTSPLPVALNTR